MTVGQHHGLRTPSEDINQRNLKIWADVADKNASAVPKNLGVGVGFLVCSKDDFLTGRSYSVDNTYRARVEYFLFHCTNLHPV